MEDRAVAGRSDLLQLSIEGLVEEESVGPWIPVQWIIVDQVSARMMLRHPTDVQQIHRAEMTLQTFMDHLHLGIAHVCRCSAHYVDHALQCLQTQQHDVLLRYDSKVLCEKPDREGHKHSGFGTLASQTLGATTLAERLLRQVTKSRQFFCWVLFVVESVEEKERGAQSNDALLNQSFGARAFSSRETFGGFQGTTCARCRPSRNSRSCAAPCPATEIDAAFESTRSGAKSTPAQDVPPSAAAGRTHRRYLEDPSKAQACHVSSGPMQGCRRRELVHGALNSACATQDVQPHLRVGLHSAA